MKRTSQLGTMKVTKIMYLESCQEISTRSAVVTVGKSVHVENRFPQLLLQRTTIPTSRIPQRINNSIFLPLRIHTQALIADIIPIC